MNTRPKPLPYRVGEKIEFIGAEAEVIGYPKPDRMKLRWLDNNRFTEVESDRWDQMKQVAKR